MRHWLHPRIKGPLTAYGFEIHNLTAEQGRNLYTRLYGLPECDDDEAALAAVEALGRSERRRRALRFVKSLEKRARRIRRHEHANRTAGGGA